MSFISRRHRREALSPAISFTFLNQLKLSPAPKSRTIPAKDQFRGLYPTPGRTDIYTQARSWIAVVMDEYSESRVEAKRDFTDFLDSDYGRATGEGKYVKMIDDIIKYYPTTKSVRLEVDLQGEQRFRSRSGRGWVGGDTPLQNAFGPLVHDRHMRASMVALYHSRRWHRGSCFRYDAVDGR